MDQGIAKKLAEDIFDFIEDGQRVKSDPVAVRHVIEMIMHSNGKFAQHDPELHWDNLGRSSTPKTEQ